MAAGAVVTGLIRALVLALALLAMAGPAGAQTAAKPARIGYLSPRPGITAVDQGFQRGLRELGWIEGGNLRVEYRWAAWRPERLPELAAELVRLPVDLIVASGGAASARAARAATGTIPIVFIVGEAAGVGLVSSIARPGENLTGVTLLNVALSGKRLALLKEAAPRVRRVGALVNPTSPSIGIFTKDMQDTALALGIEVRVVEARDAGSLEPAFSALARDGAGGLVVQPDPMFLDQRARIVALAARHRLPAAYEWKEFVEAGGLMSYGASIEAMYRRVASYVDRILKGARPGDLPVEQPTQFELVINGKTARTLGLTIPPSVLARADQVIE
jgi:putative ABC transport system substrate-binding protein